MTNPVRIFKTKEWVVAEVNLMDGKGNIFLNKGEEAQIMVYDPVKHADNPYGLRKSNDDTITMFFSEIELAKHPIRKPPVDQWIDNPPEYYRHPDNPRYEELKHCGWKLEPTI